MTLPASGPLSIQQINAEFGRGNDLNSYRGTQWYTAAGGSGTFPAGAISFSDFYGKQLASPTFSFTISSHQANANLRSLAVAAGWNQSSAVIATLASGYYIYSTAVGTPALTIDGSFPNGVTLVNNGFIMGMGGNGGGYYYSAATSPVTNIQNWGVSSGGNAINLGVSCTIQNNSYIGGGGGGGSFGGSSVTGGGGAGGGMSGSFYYYTAGTAPVTYSRTGASGGGIGSSGSNGAGAATSSIAVITDAITGGGGGRIMPGSNTGSPAASNGTVTTYGGVGGGAGNAGGNASVPEITGGTAVQNAVGIGGSAGGSGAASMYQGYYYSSGGSGGGGGWGASGGSGGSDSTITTAAINPSVTTGGKAVHLNGYSVTWAATGTRYGAIS
jgi:hypothetical protein